jgi:acetone carboxylase gamma subunit
MRSYDRNTLERLLDGVLPDADVHAIMSSYKDADRFDAMLSIYQDRLGWDERILLPLAENLFIVESDAGRHLVRCRCGHYFGDYRQNWKLTADIFVRDSRELIEEIYPRHMGSDPEWMELREFYCPGCSLLLEVEAVPPGYPIIFDFQPDLEGFYRDWLGRPLARSDGRPPPSPS